MNTTEIHLLRDINSVEYHFPVCVTEEACGRITAKACENVPERRITTRFGGMEVEPTGEMLYIEGEVLSLSEEEQDEAQIAIAAAVQYWANEREKLRKALAQ